jgi:hypothetical protein
MLVLTASRKDLIDILQRGGASDRQELRRTDRVALDFRGAEDMQLIWADRDFPEGARPSYHKSPILPRIVLVGAENRRDFLAWVWTYLTDFRPLTAYTRVLEPREFQTLPELDSVPRLGQFEEACIGLILAEAATYLEPVRDKPPAITPLSCAGTCSYAVARKLAIGRAQSETNIRDVATNWSKARRLTRQPSLRLKEDDVWMPWAALAAISGSALSQPFAVQDVPQAILESCNALFLGADQTSRLWTRLQDDHPALQDAKRAMEGPREGRIIFFERFLKSLIPQRGTPEFSDSFICGFLASQIGPGTLDYLPLLAGYLDRFPTALLWYGLCSGLQRRSSLYGFAGGLGRRVLREVTRPEGVFDPPSSDIALAELDVLAGTDAAAVTEFRTGFQGAVSIEILPLVNTITRWPPRGADQPELFSTETQPYEIRELLSQLDDLRRKMAVVQNRLAQFIDERDDFLRTAKRRR